MVIRDDLGIILQHPIDANSGGDSSRTTGLMSLFGSTIDQQIVHLFEVPNKSGLLTRHPSHYSNNCFTRDQAICLLAGIWKSGNYQLARRVFWSHAKRGFFCQNYMEQFANAKTRVRENKGFFGRDPLSPSHIGYLIICARLWFLYPFLLIAFPWFLIDLWYFTRIAPRQEQNQIVCMAKVYGCLKLWAKWHPNWEGSFLSYFGGWRDQIEIAFFINRAISEELKTSL